MFTLPFSIFALVYIALGAGGLFVLWIYTDFRDKQLYDSRRRKLVYHCIRCDHLYTGTGENERKRCPRCQHDNHRLRF